MTAESRTPTTESRTMITDSRSVAVRDGRKPHLGFAPTVTTSLAFALGTSLTDIRQTRTNASYRLARRHAEGNREEELHRRPVKHSPGSPPAASSAVIARCCRERFRVALSWFLLHFLVCAGCCHLTTRRNSADIILRQAESPGSRQELNLTCLHHLPRCSLPVHQC